MENDTPRRMPNVPPFVKFVCANVPMVFDDSLSYYEALCALWKYVQGMTDVINNNATLEEEFIEKFNVLSGKFDELKTYVDTYFDNLDVQEEINNKLDAMAESGELGELLSQYIQLVGIYVVKVGATDDLQSYLSMDCVKHIILTEDHTVTEKLFINSNTTIDLNGHTLTCDYDPVETIAFFYGLTDTFTGYDGYSNITIKNGKISGACIAMMHNKNVVIEDVEFIDVNSRHAMQIAGSYDVTVRNCIFNGTKPENETGSEAINIDPCNHGGQPWMDEDSVMYDHTPNKKIVIENNTFNTGATGYRHTTAIGSHGYDDNDQIYCYDIIIRNNQLGSPYAAFINMCDWNGVTVENNSGSFATSGTASSTYFIKMSGTLSNLKVVNNVFSNAQMILFSGNDASKTAGTHFYISDNNFTTLDNSSNPAFKLYNIKDCVIKDNNINYKEAILVLDALYSGGNPIATSFCEFVKLQGNFINRVGNSDANTIRIRCAKNVYIENNNFDYQDKTSTTGHAIVITSGLNQSDICIRNNTTKLIMNFMPSGSYLSFVEVKNNTARLLNSPYYQGSDLTASGDFTVPLTFFNKLLLQIGEGTNTQMAVLKGWLDDGDKFTTSNRTWRIPVVKADGTFGSIELNVTDNATKFNFTGDLAIRSMYVED